MVFGVSSPDEYGQKAHEEQGHTRGASMEHLDVPRSDPLYPLGWIARGPRAPTPGATPGRSDERAKNDDGDVVDEYEPGERDQARHELEVRAATRPGNMGCGNIESVPGTDLILATQSGYLLSGVLTTAAALIVVFVMLGGPFKDGLG